MDEPIIEAPTRKLASIQRVVALDPITFLNAEGKPECAGAIERARVLGWDCIVKKGEFKVGDLGVYFEIDSILPFNPWNEFLRDKNRPNKPIRLKTVKMKGQLSQGLLMPVDKICINTELGKINFLQEIASLANVTLDEGADVTKLLGVTKYEPDLPACLQGKARGTRPGYIPKTDEDRIQSNLHFLTDLQNKEVYVSQKMDGSSFSCAYHNKEFHVSSRNLDIINDPNNSFWKVAIKYDLETILAKHFADTGQELVVQGELCGPGLQANRVGLKDFDLFIFNVIDIAGNNDFKFETMRNFCHVNKLQTVPILYHGPFKWKTVEDLLVEAKGTYQLSGHEQEGIVIRPTTPEKDQRSGQRVSFKVINNDFLLKIKE